MRKHRRENRRRPGRLLAALALLVASMLLAACGSSDDDKGASTTANTGGREMACKAPDFAPPQDPDGVLAKLPQELQDQFTGYPTPVFASAWSDWKPEGSGDFKVAIAFGPLVNPVQSAWIRLLEGSLKAVPGVTVTTNVATEGTIPQQLQQYRSLVDQGVDLIVLQPITPKPFVAAVDAAARAGIPTIAVSPVPTANAVNVGINAVGSSAVLAQKLVEQMGGKGNVLEVQGLPGFQFNVDALRGFHAVFDGCKDVKVVGSVVGEFSPPVAKAKTLQFLATNPGKVDGVASPGATTVPIIEAFEQAGRPVPPIIDPGALLGELAYWKDNQADYAGLAASATWLGWTSQAVAITARRMLSGDGPLASEILVEPYVVEESDLDTVVPAGTKVSSSLPLLPQPGAKGEPTDESLAPWFASSRAGS